MVRMLAVVCCLLLLGPVAPVTAQAPVAKLTLDEAVSLARTANPTVRAKEFEVQAVGANEITAALRPNPTATFLAEQFGSGSVAVTQYTFNVGQPIELGGKRQRRIDSAKAATKVTGYELIDLKRQVIFQVKKSFTDILVAREAVALADQNLAALDELERVHRLRAEKGDISGLELLRIEVERFAWLEKLRTEAQTALSDRFNVLEKATQARERDLLLLRAELPREYIRREDHIRFETGVTGKLDALNAKLDLMNERTKGRD